MKQDETEKWTVDNFQRKLQRYVSAQEEAQNQIHLYNQQESRGLNPMVDFPDLNARFNGEAL